VIFGPITATGAAEVGETLEVNLSSGDNTIAVPVGAIAVVVVLPSTTAVVKLRTNVDSGDAGLEVSPQSAMPWLTVPLVSGATSVILNSSTSVTGVFLGFI